MSNEILVIGSLAYDSITSPAGKAERTLGGSANYFSLAASLFAPVRVVGVVGEDYKNEDMVMLRDRNVDLTGLQKKPGKTFFWEGSYVDDLNEAKTLTTDLNVFGDFNPELPSHYTNSPYVFLANIDPVLQLKVLEQIQKPMLLGSDTMNFWIHSKLSDLKKVIERVGVLLINEGEAKLLSGKSNAIAAAKVIHAMGPKAVVIKRGEYGFVLYSSEGYFILPAYPVAEVIDPTGAGDTFAGAFFGYLAKSKVGLDIASLKRACMYGSVLASYTVQDFGVSRLRKLTWGEVETRHAEYEKIVR